MFTTTNAAGTISLIDDPALAARTFVNNPTLTAALQRIGKRNSPAAFPTIGVEYHQGKRKPHRAYTESAGVKTYLGDFKLERDAWRTATEQATPPAPTATDMDEQYLISHDWIQDEAGAWVDPLSNAAYFFSNAMNIQEGRDMQDETATANE